jgi:hypothetical protein
MDATTNVMTARELAAQLRLRCATATLAKQQAKKRVTKMLAAQGRRVHEFSAKELSLLAEDYLAKHREELMAQAAMVAEQILRKR